MQEQQQFRPLADLNDYELKNADQDIRGKSVVDPAGQRIGEVRELLVDRDHDRVAAVRLDDGAVLPVEALEREGETVFVRGAEASPATSQEARIPLVREEMLIGRRTVERGCVEVRSHIVEEPVREQIALREERITVETRPAGPDSVEVPANAFRERTVAMAVTGEEAVVSKEVRVVGEVVVRKEVDERLEQVTDTVRHTEIDVRDDQGSPSDRR